MESQELTTMQISTAYCAAWLMVNTDHWNICVEFEIFMVKPLKNTVFLVFTFVLCILILSKFFIHQIMHK